MRFLVLALLALVFAGGAHAANVYVSPSGSDENPCTSPAPCLSFNRAYQVATPGSIVYVSPGSYTGQAIQVDPSKTSATDVTFHGTGGVGANTVASLNVYAHDITFRYLTVTSNWYARPGSHHLRFYQMRQTRFYITSAFDITIDGGEVGPEYTTDDSQIKTASGSSSAPTNILIKNVWFHDITRTPGAHVECLQVGGAVNLTIQNSRFTNCATHDVFVRSWGELAGPGTYSPLTNIVLTGNRFETTLDGFYVVQLYDDLAPAPGSFTVTNNTCVGQRFHVDIAGTLVASGNVGCLN